MSTIKHLLLILCFNFFVISCQPVPEPNESLPDLPTQPPTLTQLAATPTLQQLTHTPTFTPTETNIPTSTSIPFTPTATSEPFLPKSLSGINLENITHLQKIAEIPVAGIYSLVFSQTGNKVATISERWQDRSRFLEVWDLLLGQQILFLDNLKNPWQTFFSLDETQLSVFYPNRSIEIYDLNQQKLIQTTEMNVDRIDYSPDRKYLATGEVLGIGEESIIKVVEVDSGKEFFSGLNTGMVMNIKFSPDGKLLIAGIQRGNHFHDYVWEISTGDLKADLIDYYFGLNFSPDSSLGSISKGTFINILSTGSWVVKNTFNFSDPYKNANPKFFTPDRKILAFEDRYKIVFMSTETGAELLNLDNECDARISPTATILVTWCYQSNIKIWAAVP